MKKIKDNICIIAIALAIFSVLFFSATPIGRQAWNQWFWKVQKVDDVTSYNTRKKVEDTCRAMMASYESDKLAWEQYKDSESEEKQGWADQAKMRANKTAATYNNYILENSYVWKDNVPSDIRQELAYLVGDGE